MNESVSDDEKEVMDRTWNRTQELSYKEAFREGALNGKDTGFEIGRNVGYKAGFESGYSVGIFNGIKQILEFYKSSDEDNNENEFENIQNGVCYLCAEKNGNDAQDIKDASNYQNLFLNKTLKNKLSYDKLIDKYVTAAQ